jgi:hypothetical protein
MVSSLSGEAREEGGLVRREVGERGETLHPQALLAAWMGRRSRSLQRRRHEPLEAAER